MLRQQDGDGQGIDQAGTRVSFRHRSHRPLPCHTTPWIADRKEAGSDWPEQVTEADRAATSLSFHDTRGVTEPAREKPVIVPAQ